MHGFAWSLVRVFVLGAVLARLRSAGVRIRLKVHPGLECAQVSTRIEIATDSPAEAKERVMAAVRMAELPTASTDALVVGAGPTGLMAALVLTRRGVPVVVVDQKEGPTRESRALVVQARTMEIYDQLGLADQVLAGAYPALRVQIGTDPPLGGVSIARLQQGETRFPGIQIFEQSANEQLLSRSLAAEAIEVLWRHRLIDLIDDTGQTEGQVVVLLDGPAG